MIKLFNNCLTTLNKLTNISSPIIIPVRFRYWAERKHVFRRWGYEDKLAWSGPLPRIENGHRLPMPPYAPKNPWSEKKALFGQNDYIDILGDGNIHPVKISYNVPGWLRGFRGNEYQMLIRKRKFLGHRISSSNPDAYNSLRKRLKFLYKVFNYRKKAIMTRDFAVMK